jgi:hypothetical protein
MVKKRGKLVEEASSYGPINLIPIMNKIFEKAMLKRLHPMPKENQVLPDHQLGFRQKHSTALHLGTSTPNYRDRRSYRKKNSTALRLS